MTRLCVAHLVWGPLVERLGPFIASYRQHPAGIDHELVVIFNGLSAGERALAERALEGLTYTPLVPPAPTFDITAYGLVPRSVEADAYLFLNSYSRLLAPDWGRYYADALSQSGVGLVGAGGCWASARSWRTWPPDPGDLPARKLPGFYRHTLRIHLHARLAYPPAPWPWIRTNAFALTAATFASIDWPECHSKEDTWQAEMGRRCISERVRRTGQRCVVVDRLGRTFEMDDWQRCDAYASGDQANLLVADNRTDEYQAASSEDRADMVRILWAGRRAASGSLQSPRREPEKAGIL